jgi:hypothetical protein
MESIGKREDHAEYSQIYNLTLGSVSGGIFIFTIGGLFISFLTVLLEVLYQRKYVMAKAKRTARNMFGPPTNPGNDRSSAKKKKKHSSDAKDDSKKDEKNKRDTKESKNNEKNKPGANDSKQPTSVSIKK